MCSAADCMAPHAYRAGGALLALQSRHNRTANEARTLPLAAASGASYREDPHRRKGWCSNGYGSGRYRQRLQNVAGNIAEVPSAFVIGRPCGVVGTIQDKRTAD